MTPEPLSGPFQITAAHDVTTFDCGTEALNVFLKKRALQSQQARSTRTFVLLRGSQVAGYFSLTYGAISHEDAPDRVRHGMPAYPIPILVLARLAVDTPEQGHGLGSLLLRHVFLKAVEAGERAGLRAIFVHAKTGVAAAFYARYGFKPLANDPLYLYILMKNVEHNLR